MHPEEEAKSEERANKRARPIGPRTGAGKSLRHPLFFDLVHETEWDKGSEKPVKGLKASSVFNGRIKNWKAFVEWNPDNGGLDYLQERLGSSTAEAMLSKTEPVFYGDIRNHERVQFLFPTFIDFCKQSMRNTDNSPDSLPQSDAYEALCGKENVAWGFAAGGLKRIEKA
ncbi:hypothetical protein DKX38_002129 [Salix brachista]|uniref:Uncharacterized protein n=1 Tax=Salix brachista TaxID=2182728 RepID=A0A5N5NQ23_9ROSI|nr:hypothetical protein DKX38_002129 [Salix brachista]